MDLAPLPPNFTNNSSRSEHMFQQTFPKIANTIYGGRYTDDLNANTITKTLDESKTNIFFLENWVYGSDMKLKKENLENDKNLCSDPLIKLSVSPGCRRHVTRKCLLRASGLSMYAVIAVQSFIIIMLMHAHALYLVSDIVIYHTAGSDVQYVLDIY